MRRLLFSWDLGRRTSLTRGNGTSTSYAYDPASRLSQLTQDIGGTAADLTLGFSYNPASQIVTNTRSNDAYSFTAHTSGTTTSTVNGLNQLTAQGGASITHDLRGNITSDGTRTFHYTADNQLASSTNSNFAYDPVGRLFHQETPNLTFHYDGTDLLVERNNATGAILRRYVHGPGIDEPLVWYEGAGTSDKRYLHEIGAQREFWVHSRFPVTQYLIN